jgi:hypothetical protein
MITSLSWGEVLAKIWIEGKYSGAKNLEEDVERRIFESAFEMSVLSSLGLLISNCPSPSSLSRRTLLF